MAFSQALEEVIEAALADGVLTDKERAVLHKRAAQEGVDPDELDVVIEGRLAKMKRETDWLKPAPPASEKRGNIVKCPSCGASVPGGAAVCPECGHEFRNIQVNNTAKEFAKGLAEIEKRYSEKKNSILDTSVTQKLSEIASYINNFPVPNSGDDLLEMLSFIQPNAKKSNVAYFNLYSSCINKARMNFSNDKRFAPYYAYYDAEAKKNPSRKFWFWYFVALVALLIIAIVCFHSIGSSEDSEKEIINNQKTELVEKIHNLATPNAENYTDLRTQLLRINWNRINPKGDGWRAEKEDAAYETFMSEKRSYAEILNAFYMETHNGESDPALKSLLEVPQPNDGTTDNASDSIDTEEKTESE